MHESHLVADLVARVESHVDPDQERVGRLIFSLGALSSTSPEALKTGIVERTTLQWGYAPEVVVDRSNDLDHPGAMGVTLVSIQVG